MEGHENDYRIHITIRRRGQPVFISTELKTENFNSFDELSEHIDRFITEEMELDNDAALMEG